MRGVRSAPYVYTHYVALRPHLTASGGRGAFFTLHHKRGVTLSRFSNVAGCTVVSVSFLLYSLQPFRSFSHFDKGGGSKVASAEILYPY